MKNKMGITLIVIGVVFVGIGVWLTLTKADGKNEVVELSQRSAANDKAVNHESRQNSDMAVSEIEIHAESEFIGNESTKPTADCKTQSDAKRQGADEKGSVPASKDEAKRKGNDFEGYVADILKANGIRLKEWNQGSTSPEGAYAENELNPDFKVAHQDEQLEYWVECKYRSTLPKQGFALEDYQLNRYYGIQGKTRRKILIVLGVGGEASHPRNFYIIPLDTLQRFKRVGHKFLPHYEIGNPRGQFKRHVSDWFRKEVFVKGKK